MLTSQTTGTNEIDIYNSKGIACSKRGKYDQAIANFSKVIELNPELAIVYYNRGVAYGKKGEVDLAIEDYAKAVRLNPHYLDAYNNRGIAFNIKGEHELAIQDFDKVIQLEPKFALAYYNRGVAWLFLRKWEKARVDLTVAQNSGLDITANFHNINILNFEQKIGVQLPKDITEMLTRQQD